MAIKGHTRVGIRAGNDRHAVSAHGLPDAYRGAFS
jgi:hypothetical protein